MFPEDALTVWLTWWLSSSYEASVSAIPLSLSIWSDRIFPSQMVSLLSEGHEITLRTSRAILTFRTLSKFTCGSKIPEQRSWSKGAKDWRTCCEGLSRLPDSPLQAFTFSIFFFSNQSCKERQHVVSNRLLGVWVQPTEAWPQARLYLPGGRFRTSGAGAAPQYLIIYHWPPGTGAQELRLQQCSPHCCGISLGWVGLFFFFSLEVLWSG